MKVVSESDLRVALLSGAVVLFEAGVEREVSDEIGSVALQMGAKLSGAPEPVVESAEEPAETWVEEVAAMDTDIEINLNDEPKTFEDLDAVVAAIETLVNESNPEDFKTDNSPKAAAVTRVAGRTVATDEREAAWQAYLDR